MTKEKMLGRGALIVFEGLDRSGKSTQSQLLLSKLISDVYKMKCELWKYPNRETKIGALINDYLTKKSEINDQTVHLLFSANRWETVDEMKQKLNSGISLIIDRYAYSGTAYSAAKKTLDFDWCKQCDNGLPKPDLICFLDTSAHLARIGTRDAFGEERYEKIEFLSVVYKNYEKFFKYPNTDEPVPGCFIIDAMQPIDHIHEKILAKVLETIENVKQKPIDTLW